MEYREGQEGLVILQSTFCFEVEGKEDWAITKNIYSCPAKIAENKIVQREPRVKIEQVLSAIQVLFFMLKNTRLVQMFAYQKSCTT